MHSIQSTLRSQLGALYHDVPRFLWRVESPVGGGWSSYCNRHEKLEVGPDGLGRSCCWKWTSDLYLPTVFPGIGRRLLRKCIRQWPISTACSPKEPPSKSPKVSFVIGHRGRTRLPNLLITVASIAAQDLDTVECIVVEQSPFPIIREELPAWVRYIHTAAPEGAPYSRSWAFNVGAKIAHSDILILHDNDMLVPQSYARTALQRHEDGYEVLNLKRFIFYLSQRDSESLSNESQFTIRDRFDAIVQNLEGGGSLSITKDAYQRIGGFDEDFVGWGGEDNEFWDRAMTLKTWRWGYLPLIHTWHPPQPEKVDPNRHTACLLSLKMQRAAQERIAVLLKRARGTAGIA